MARRDREKLREVPRWIRPPPDRQEIDDLNKQPRLAAAGLAHDAHEVAQSRQKAIVSDPQQWATGYFPDACRLDNNRARAAARETLIPVENVGGYDAVFTGTPRNHGGHPGALGEFDGADLDGGEEE